MATTDRSDMEAEQTQEQSYNGWKNYATWGVKLVLDNDHDTYLRVRAYVDAFKAEAAESSQVKDGIWDEDQYVRFTLADWVKDYTEELCDLESDDGPTMMARQVISAGL